MVTHQLKSRSASLLAFLLPSSRFVSQAARERQGIIHQQAENERTLGSIQQQILNAQEDKRLAQVARDAAARQAQASDELGGLQANQVEKESGVWRANALRRQQGAAQITRDTDLQIEELERAGLLTEELRNNLLDIRDLKIDSLNDQFKSLGDTIDEALQGSFKQFFTGLITGSQSAAEAFKGLVDSILSNLAELAINQIFTDLLGGKGLGIAGLFGGGRTSDIDFLPPQSEGSGIGGIAQGALSLFGMIGGGGIPMFADGGVVNKSTLAMIGEGQHPEAVIPMPNGRSVGVELKGNKGGGSNINSNITVNVSPSGATSSSSSGKAGQLSRELESAVIQVIQKHRKPGGALSN